LQTANFQTIELVHARTVFFKWLPKIYIVDKLHPSKLLSAVASQSV